MACKQPEKQTDSRRPVFWELDLSSVLEHIFLDSAAIHWLFFYLRNLSAFNERSYIWGAHPGTHYFLNPVQSNLIVSFFFYYKTISIISNFLNQPQSTHLQSKSLIIMYRHNKKILPTPHRKRGLLLAFASSSVILFFSRYNFNFSIWDSPLFSSVGTGLESLEGLLILAQILSASLFACLINFKSLV